MEPEILHTSGGLLFEEVSLEGGEGGRTERPSSSPRGPYEYVLMGVSVLFAIICIGFVVTIILEAVPAFKQQGSYLFTGTTWQQGGGSTPSQYGGLSMIVGTFQVAVVAMVAAVVIGMGTALSIVFFLPLRLRNLVATLVELLAAVPSVVYGIFGYLVLAPWVLTTLGPFLSGLPGGTAIFGSVQTGTSMLLASVVVAVMVLPTFVAIAREVLSAVPHELSEASLSLGATQWQTLSRTVIPTARIGLFGAAALALGRAIGETVAVALVAGQVNQISWKSLEPGTTLASWIANNFGEATGDQVNALFALGVILMAISLATSLFSRWLVARQRRAAAVV